MCDSKNCEQTQTSTDYYCCEPIVTLTEASGECSPTASESVCKSSGCCSSSSECLSGSWCSTFGNRCVDCPVSGDEGYFNGFCANENCLGSDIDCCATDSDCDDASSASGSIHYCNSETITCETCTASMDFYCPSPECYESGIGTGDPDCCASDSDCIEGSQCVDTDSNGTAETCAPKNIGKICMGDDCGDGLTCITNYKGESRCVLDEFLIITPSSLEMKVGEIRYANVIVRDPQLLEDDYLVSLSGTQLPFVKIEDGTSTSVHIGPNQVRKMTLVVYGGRTIDASSVKIYASSKRTSGISAEKSLTLTVAGSSGSGLVLAAPGITFTQSVAILVLGGVLIWSMKKL
jgi:hypothetical protein